MVEVSEAEFCRVRVPTPDSPIKKFPVVVTLAAGKRHRTESDA